MLDRTRRALDRRLGLRRRRRHPGRPEGLRPLRRARDDRDHGADGAEHGGGDRASTRSRPSSSSSRCGPSRPTSASTRSRSACSGTAETVRAVREALGHIDDGVPIVIDPVMVAESGAVLLDDEARAAIVTELLPLATVITPNLPGGARARGGAGADVAPGAGRAAATTSRISRGRCTRSGPTTWSSRAATATRPRTSSSTARRSRCCRASAIPTAPRTGPGCTHSSALAAHLALGFTPLEAARAARAIASEAVRDGHREIGAGPGPGQRAGRRRPAPDDRGTGWRGARDIMRRMKFLRMRPGYGEQLIAEGDIEVGEDEQMLVEEFRRQLEQGMWAAIPVRDRERPARGRDGARVRGHPARRRSGHLLPARRGRGAVSSRGDRRPLRHGDRRHRAPVGGHAPVRRAPS